MKTFYTERDIVDMHNAGVTRIAVNENVVLTALARDKAQDLGISLETVETIAPSSAINPASKVVNKTDLVSQVKARVIARLGTDEFNGLLDQVIPQILAQLNVQSSASQGSSSPPSQTTRDY